jgi:ubiquinone/menaquinone biosynthesis C-methylase UbiE
MGVAEHPGTGRGRQRRSAVRTMVVWDALQASLDRSTGERLQVLDLGGGTGGFAVRVAGSGHQVTVVDPNPDALAALARRAAESGLSDRVHGVQGDATDLVELVSEDSVDMVLCHGVLEVVDDPEQALGAVASVLRAGGLLSVLVAQRAAAVLARAVTGHLADAERLLRDEGGRVTDPPPRRFSETAIVGLVEASGYRLEAVHGVRVFADLVPAALVDGEPGAIDALLRLEAAAADRPEFRAVATQLHVLAERSKPPPA